MSDSETLFFRDVVRRYTSEPRYARRNWLTVLIGNNLAQRDTRYVVVIGAPGSGKSSLIAQLAEDYPGSLVYFLRYGQRTPLAEGSAKSFLVRVGLQFSSLHPDVFDTDAIRLEVTQSSNTTSVDSEVTGARIGRLLASPFYQTIIRIQQQVGSLGGRLTGVEIEEIVSDPNLLSVSDLQALALRTPANVLLKRRSHERLVIMVDALDELACHTPARDDLLSWLRDQPVLPENIRFVLTSRPGEALDAFLEKQAPFVARVWLDPTDERVKKDVTAYTHVLASQMRKEKILVDNDAESRFVDDANEKALGNLGYVAAIGRAFDHALTGPDRQSALEALLRLDQLPPTLEKLYGFFFHQIKARLTGQVVEIENKASAAPSFLPSWPGLYQKVLAVLSVAYEPLTADQIADLGQIAAARTYVVSALENLAQFLRRDAEGSRMSLYHPTVAEFLTEPTTRNDPALFVDRMWWNGHIAALLKTRFFDKPQAMDEYAIKYRIRHQIAGYGPESAHQAMTSGWMLFKRKRTGDDRSFHADMMEVVQSLREQTPFNIVALVRCCVVDAVLLARPAVLPPTVASIWAICGQRVRAQSLISLISNAGKRAETFLQLAHGLEVAGEIESARNALRSAIEAAKTNPYYGDRLATLHTILSTKFIDSDVASAALDVATMTEATTSVETSTELSWEHRSLAAIYEGAASFLTTTRLAELNARLQQFLQKPSDATVRASILISAARVSDLLGNASDAASFAELALAETDCLPGIDAIKTLCAAAYRLKRLTDQKWTAKAIGDALSRLRKGLDANAESYAIPIIAKSGLDTIAGFDSSQVDIDRASELARGSKDAGAFQLLTDLFAAQGDAKRATEAADLCYQTVLMLHGKNQSRFTEMVSLAVIPAFRSSRNHSGLLELTNVAARFRSPGREWERDRLVDIVSNAAVDLRFNDVLESAFNVARNTRNVWERASALSRVGNAYAMAGDKPRALSIARGIEDIVAEGLRRQFPRNHVRGALLLATATSDSAPPMSDVLTEESIDPRYLAVTQALTCGGAADGSEERRSLKSIVESLSKWEVAVIPLYTLLKKAVAEKDVDALAAVERWEQETSNAMTSWTVRDLRILAMKTDSQELVDTAWRVVDSFDTLDVIPEAALAVVDALVSAERFDEASSIVDRLRNSTQRLRADANEQVAREAAACLATLRLKGGAGLQKPLITLLDHAREVGMLSTARTIADTATAIAALFGPQSAMGILGPIDEAATLE